MCIKKRSFSFTITTVNVNTIVLSRGRMRRIRSRRECRRVKRVCSYLPSSRSSNMNVRQLFSAIPLLEKYWKFKFTPRERKRERESLYTSQASALSTQLPANAFSVEFPPNFRRPARKFHRIDALCLAQYFGLSARKKKKKISLGIQSCSRNRLTRFIRGEHHSRRSETVAGC